jgi:hypothetical protein
MAITCFVMMKLLRRRKLLVIRQKVFVCFFLWLQEFHESLIDLLLPLKGCASKNVSSHVKIGGGFIIFRF